MAKYVKTEQGYIDMPSFAPAPFKPAGKSYLTFSSPNSFTLAVNDSTKHWNGTLEYFSADKVWAVWDGTTILSAYNNDGEYVLYLRGTGNTVITSGNFGGRWVPSGTNIKCIGNIDNLLDYTTVESGNHPTMASNCYQYMFQDCTSLISAPELPATTLANNCYNSMFFGCTSLKKAPELPATTLAICCYGNMFTGCASLTQAPSLPATTLANNCYQYMFQGCTSLTQAPSLPATTLASNCYQYMFTSCTSLTQAPSLPATTLADLCYCRMFYSCTSLKKAPELPATTLANKCYQYMFQGCTSLTQAPSLPATTLASNCYQYMFQDCTSLISAPELPATTLADLCYYGMFQGCTIKLSTTQTGKYNQAYRIPTTGDGITAREALNNMFPKILNNNGSTLVMTPKINTTYYISTDNMIVRDTEVATLNGYVGSMIDVAIGEYADTAEYIIPSSTEGSTKKLKITVDDSGALTATEITQQKSNIKAPSFGVVLFLKL